MNSPKLRLIQSGVGGHGLSWIKGASTQSPDFDLVAIVDVVPANLEAAAQTAGIAPELCFDSLAVALESVEADALLTVTPPAIHLPQARLAFERGLHVMTEKPFADTIENAREMLKLAEQANRQLTISQNYRFSAPMQTLKTQLQNKAVGDFGHGHLDFYIPADFTGSFRETMEFPLLIDMAIHHLDLIRSVTGQNIARVTAHSFRPSWSWYQHDPGLKMLLEMDDGAHFSYAGDWSALGRSTSWNGNWRLQCSEGALHFEDDKVLLSRSEKWSQNQSVETIETTPLEFSSADATLHQFAEAIRSGTPSETSGEDNLYSFGAVAAAVRSIREKRSVEVREIIEG